MGVTYNSTGTRKLPLSWRCPTCGKLNVDTYQITATGSNRNKDRAEELMRSTLETKALDTVLDVENRRFDRVRFNNKCSQCGNVPSWSNLPAIPPKVLKILRNIALAAAVVLAISSLSSSSTRQVAGLWSLVAAGLFAALALMCMLTRNKMLEEQSIALNALPAENRPWLAPTGPELKRRLIQEHILTTEEMNALESTGSSEADNSRNLSDEYRVKAESRKAKDRSRQIRNIVITAIVLAIFGGLQFNNIQTAGWEEKMEKANLFTANPGAGEKFVVYETLRTGKARFVKKYLTAGQQAAKPEDVGYVIVIEDSTQIVGTYSVGSAKTGNAYRIHSTLRLFDCHTGDYIGNPISLSGGDPPKSIKSSQGSGYGSRPNVSNAVSELVQRVR